MNCAAIDRAKTTRRPAIRYFTYIPNPLCEISKLSSGLARLLPFVHSPMVRMIQHSGTPRSMEPSPLVHALRLSLNRA